MLSKQSLSQAVIKQLQNIFLVCQRRFPEVYEHMMPFGHGVFSDVTAETPDLHRLWIERISHLLRRPLVAPHAFTDVIEEAYPWRDPKFSVDHDQT